MIPTSWNREKNIDYHYFEGKKWLSKSHNGERSTALAYAAFEFRLALERIIFQYWYILKSDDIKDKDINDIRSFKTMQNRIYEISGYQKIINKKFEFARIPLEMLKIKPTLITPDFGKMHKNWSDCSELCHLGWTLVADDKKIVKEQYITLTNISIFLTDCINGLVSWVKIKDQAHKELEEQFVNEEISTDQVREKLRKKGLWARTEFENNAQPNEFIGEAVPPTIK